MNKIITIGREFGSGGRELGKRLADELGYAYYDKEIVTEIAKRTALSEQYVQSIIENKPIFSYPIHTARTFRMMPTDLHVDFNSAVFAEQKKYLEELAEKANCVIVGRCADYILRKYKPYRIFVYADTGSKIARCKQKGRELVGLTDKQVAKHIKRIDKNRAKYYSFYTGKTWGDKLNYDLCVNTTDCVIADIVPHIAKML